MQALIEACMEEDGKLYLCVSSPTIKDKPVSSSSRTPRSRFHGWRGCLKFQRHFAQVQIRPWNLSDSDFVMDGSQPLDPRKTIFVGGVPRPLRASRSSHPIHTLPNSPPSPCRLNELRSTSVN